ncbi:hypothetical protein Bca52824_078077 [Brassica carinata]|uniref:4-hydroxy-tetrahydrodipicolinate synthase n=1 Tax=Brassica carinata TaxID=52824 RepID=A0A8X7PYF5_BRACI|nr:hypothetical protein Bca52824_078077 [Brassica carinata]
MLGSLSTELFEMLNKIKNIDDEGVKGTTGLLSDDKGRSDEILVGDNDLAHWSDHHHYEHLYGDGKDTGLIEDDEDSFGRSLDDVVPWEQIRPPSGCTSPKDILSETSCKPEKWLKCNDFDEKSILNCEDYKLTKPMRDNEGIITNLGLVGIQVDSFYQENSKWYMILLVKKTMDSDMERFCRNTGTNTEDIRSLRVITAIKTPYLPDGRFDLEAYDNLVNTQIEKGAEGVIVGGTTGEGQLMSWDEHIMLIGHTVNCFGARIKVIGNTGSNSTREAIHATEQGFAVGMHAALHINPYYGKTSIEGMTAHFQTVLHMGPTIIYNVPGRTSQDIPPHVIFKLSRNANFAGVKECVGNNRVEEYTENGIVVWSGNDDQCHDSRWDHGGLELYRLLAIWFQLLPLIDWVFQEPNPIGVNTALAQLGVARPVFRLPYVPLPMSKRVEFVKLRDVQVLDDDDFILIGRY